MTKPNIYSVQYEDMTDEQKADIQTVKEHIEATDQAKQADKESNDALKASAKAKLIAGEALTEEEANTIVL